MVRRRSALNGRGGQYYFTPLPGMLTPGGFPRSGGGLYRSPVSSFTPASVAGLVLWLKADSGTYQDADATTVAAADADPVGGWLNQVTGITYATQSTADKRPVLKLNILTGKSVIRFDGADGGDSLEAAAIGTGIGATLFVVGVRRGVPGNNACLVALKKGAGNNDYDAAGRAVLGFFPAATRMSAYRNNAELSDAGAWPAVDAAFLHSSVFDGVNHTSYLNGVAGTAVASVGSFDFTSILLAARWYSDAEQNPHFQVDLAEVILYNTALSTGQLAQIHNYLNTRWSVY